MCNFPDCPEEKDDKSEHGMCLLHHNVRVSTAYPPDGHKD